MRFEKEDKASSKYIVTLSEKMMTKFKLGFAQPSY